MEFFCTQRIFNGRIVKLIPVFVFNFIFFILNFTDCALIKVHAAIDHREPINKEKLFELKHKIEQGKQELQKISKEINAIDITLALKNKKYLSLSSERAILDERLNQAKKHADINHESLKKYIQQTQNILMGLLINKLENSEKSSDLLTKKILKDELQRKLIDLQGLIKISQESNAELEVLNLKLQESMNLETELIGVMEEQEARKKALRDALKEKEKNHQTEETIFLENKNILAQKSAELRRQREKAHVAPMQITEQVKYAMPIQNSPEEVEVIKIGDEVLSGGFRPPIDKFYSFEYQKKGVTFSFQGRHELRATRSGKIMYTGPLANYGNVVMINHGDNTRTVLLGQFDYSVKMGDEVSEAQVIGQTAVRTPGEINDGKIYFEVRKNNIALNTYLLLDKKLLAKNQISQ